MDTAQDVVNDIVELLFYHRFRRSYFGDVNAELSTMLERIKYIDNKDENAYANIDDTHHLNVTTAVYKYGWTPIRSLVVNLLDANVYFGKLDLDKMSSFEEYDNLLCNTLSLNRYAKGLAYNVLIDEIETLITFTTEAKATTEEELNTVKTVMDMCHLINTDLGLLLNHYYDFVDEDLAN
jgi:hypothetical protein